VNPEDEEQALDAAASAAELVEEPEAVEASEEEQEVEEPKVTLEEAQAQATEYLDGWQRARAEFANYRRREEQRREHAASEIAARVVGHFLPVLDDLERAFSTVPDPVRDTAWLDGLALVGQKMLAGMEKEGVAVMPTQEGDDFDPNFHMAVLHVPCADYDEGKIAMVLQRGYTIGERVLRPAMVQVSSGRIEACEAQGAAQGATEEPADETGQTEPVEQPAE
jgi:molecular chaperone GrpE